VSGPAWGHSGPECPHHAGINHVNQVAKVIFMELNKMWEREGFYTQHSEMGVILQVGVRSFSCLRNRHNNFFSRRDIHENNVASTHT
jgi:hypothetical protein